MDSRLGEGARRGVESAPVRLVTKVQLAHHHHHCTAGVPVPGTAGVPAPGTAGVPAPGTAGQVQLVRQSCTITGQTMSVIRSVCR